MRASELSYRRWFEATRIGILILDADTGRVLDANPFLLGLLGFSHAELFGASIWELGAFKDIVSSKARFEELRQQGCVLAENLPLSIRDGRKLTADFASHVYPAGKRKAMQCLVRDVTERQCKEERLLALNLELERRAAESSAQMKSSNEQLESFSYSVSHDLRAPLRQIIGFADMLQKAAGPALQGKSLSCLAAISQSARRMGEMIDDLLTYSRIGLSEMRKTQVDLSALVGEALKEVGPDANRKIAWQIHPLPKVQGDGSLLRLALVNLISNAVKFTGGRAEAQIEIGCLSKGDGESVIFIRDNGVGFDPRHAGKLFGVFQRLHSQAEFEGTGLGLANVQRTIVRHGGRIWAEGTVDAGATFYFSIPNPPGLAGQKGAAL